MSVDWTSSGQQIAEGRVSDDETCAHYVAEEDAALWRYPAEPGAADPPEVVDRVRPDGYLAADIEGLALHRGPEGAGYLLTSSQGSDEHAVLRRIQPAARPPIGRTSSWSPGGSIARGFGDAPAPSRRVSRPTASCSPDLESNIRPWVPIDAQLIAQMTSG